MQAKTSRASPGDGPVTSRHVARGIGSTILSRLGSLVEIVSQPLYVAMFGLASFGLYAVLWAAVNLIENIFDLGMTSALQRTVPQAKSDAEAVASLRAALLLGVGPCFLAAVAAAIFAPQIAPMLNVAAKDVPLVAPSIRLFIWTLPLWAFVEVATSALRARHLFGAEIRLRIVWEQIIRLVLAAILYLAGFGLTGLFLAHISSLFVTAVLCLRLLGRHYRLSLLFKGPVFQPIFHDTLKAGTSILPGNIVARLFGDAPALVLNMLIPGAAGASAAALFTIARKISSAVQLVRIAFVYVLAPLASSALKHDIAHVRDIYSYAVRFILVIALPLAVTLSAATHPIMGVFGKGADAATTAVVLMIVARALEAILGISLPVMQVISGYAQQLLASIIGLVVACIAGFFLVSGKEPLTGVTAAVAIGIVVSAAIPMIQLYVHDGLHPFDGQMRRVAVRAIGISLIAFALAWAVSHLPDAAALPIAVTITLAAIWCAMRFALPLEDRLSLGKTARKLRLLPPVPLTDMPPAS